MTDAPAIIPPVVGINFGNSYASIAVFTKEGLAECIANEDGERQIACAVAFHGEETYIGNQAKQQLVKNSKNTITGFRNLLGKKFSEIPQSQTTTSAPVIQHPDIPDEPAYQVDVLQPAPTPLPASTPAGSVAATPRSEPTPATRILTVSEVATLFLSSLIQSAQDFLGEKVEGAVITVPPNFTDAQKAALRKVATEAGISVYQLLEEAGAATVTTTAEQPSDRTQLVVDLGSSTLHLTLLSIRAGLAHVLASSTHEDISGNQIDDKLIKFLAGEFTKKTKTPLAFPAASPQDARAEAKLRLAIEHTKRTLSASPGAATCSVESLKDGMDFTGSVNRLRFDMIARPVYAAVTDAVTALLAEANTDAYHVDEIVYVGGTTCLPGLDEHLCLTGGFSEERIQTPFSAGTVVGGGIGDPTTLLARGCAIQAALIAGIDDEELKEAFLKPSEVSVTTKSIGLLFPDGSDGLGGTWIPLVVKETPLPTRRIIPFELVLPEDEPKRFAFEVWEVEEGVRVEKVKPPPPEEPEEDEEEEEEIEVKHLEVKKQTLLAAAEAEANLGIKTLGPGGKWTTTVQVTAIVTKEGKVDLSLKELGKDGAEIRLNF